MSFKVVGKGIFTREALLELLKVLEINNPDSVIREAERGRVICGDYRILSIR